LVVVTGCASQGIDVTTLPRFSEADRTLFDDGVDMVAEPEGLGGPLLAQWEGELGQRLEHSDIVAVGRFHTVRETVDLDHQATHRLIMKVETRYRGKAKGDLTLGSRHDAPGHETIGRHRDRLLKEKFVAFVRRFRSDRDEVELHFRLMPATESLLQRLDAHFQSQRDNIKRIRITQPAQ
jgi:hypothetical protein